MCLSACGKQLIVLIVADPLSDACRLVLLYNKKDDLFRAKILDPNIQDVKLADKGSELGNWKPPASHLTNLKFRQVLFWGSSLCKLFRDACSVVPICLSPSAGTLKSLVMYKCRLSRAVKPCTPHFLPHIYLYMRIS